MVNYTVLFLVIALIAGILGFGVVTGTAAAIAKILFMVSIGCFMISLLVDRKPRT